MNKELRRLKVTAEEIGRCLLCNGGKEQHDGGCITRKVKSIHKTPSPATEITCWSGIDKEGAEQYLLCFRCRLIVGTSPDEQIVRCQCGNTLRRDIKPAIPEPDYSLIEVSEVPRSARRKPKPIKA